MKKSLVALSAIGVLLSNMAFAHPHHGKHNPEFKKAVGECFAEAGVKKPDFKDKQDRKNAPKSEQKASAKDQQGKSEHKHKHHKHPKFEMTDAQKSQVESCLKQKGFEKPAKPEFKKGQAPKTEQK